MITSQDIQSTKFSATKFRAGYDIEEVDDFLDEAGLALTAWTEGAPDVAHRLGSDAVRSRTFTVVKFREGYDMSEVDALLDRVVEALTQHEARAGSPAPIGSTPAKGAAEAAGAPTGPALGLRDLVTRLEYARLDAQGSDAVRVVLPDGSVVAVVGVDAGPDGVVLRAG